MVSKVYSVLVGADVVYTGSIKSARTVYSAVVKALSLAKSDLVVSISFRL